MKSILGVGLLLAASLAACAEDEPSSRNEAALVSAPAIVVGAFEIFMTTGGRDSADGLTVQTAIATLARAHEIVAALPADFDADVVVRIGAGEYRAHPPVLWRRVIPGHSIAFEPLDPEGPMPVFDGTPSMRHWWFELDYEDGPSRLRFHGLSIERYPLAISFAGGLDPTRPGNGENEIEGMQFRSIGGIDNDDFATPALHLRKSWRNTIRNNRFIWVAPTPKPGSSDLVCNGLHVMYLADGSSGNDIAHNRFEDVCAESPIKFRNGSNDNIVAGNDFLHAGAHVVLTSLTANMSRAYFEHDPDRPGECPPVGNRVFYNTYCGGFFDQPVTPFSDNTDPYPDDSKRLAAGLPACERASDDRPAIRTYGNVDAKVSPTPWCYSLSTEEIRYRWSYWPFPVDGYTPF